MIKICKGIIVCVFLITSIFSKGQTPPWSPFLQGTGCDQAIGIMDTVFNLSTIQVDSGDYIGAFYDSSGVLVCGGYSLWNDLSTAISINGDINSTPEKEGFSIGEKITFQLWRHMSDSIIPLYPIWMPVGGVFDVADSFLCSSSSGVSEFMPNYHGIQGELSGSGSSVMNPNGAKVFLINYNTGDTVSTKTLTSGISYQFDSIYPGSYYMKAKLPYMNLHMPTYYNGNSIKSAIYWDDAYIFDLTSSPDLSMGHDIVLQSIPPPMKGTAQLSGYLIEGSNFLRGPGDPLDNIIIGMINQSGDSLAGVAVSNGNGYFEFNNVDSGTYTLVPDIFGVLVDTSSSNSININDGDSLSFNFTVDSSGVVPDITTSVIYKSYPKLKIYPNPSDHLAIIEFSNPDKLNFKLSVFDVYGNLVRQVDDLYTDRYIFNNANLSKGMYLIELSSRSQIQKGRLFIK